MIKISDLKILSLNNPIGTDAVPYFSYTLESDKAGVFQSEYRVLVKDGSKVVYEDGGKTEKTTFLPLDFPLKSFTRYDVEVIVKSNKNESAKTTAFFETAMLDESDWRAKWVKSSLPVFPAEKGFGKQPPPTIFTKRFTVSEKVKKARLYCTCHGIYVPFLNGKDFGENQRFAPGHSSYEKVLFYQTYETEKLLTHGENVLSFYVGDGWYLGVKTTPRVKNYERLPAVIFQLEIEYENGVKQTIVSDEEVACSYGKVVFSDLFAGEKYDERIVTEISRKCVIADYGYKNIMADPCYGVREIAKIPVKVLIRTPKGENVLDFGKVLAGRIRVKTHMKRGETLTMLHTESLDKDGNFISTAEMPDGGVEQRDEYVSDGTEKIYEPLFTYHGFRYVKIEGIENPKPEDFTAVVYSSECENLGEFACSDEKINKLYENIRNSQKSNFFSIPTDCPQREKAGWTGDISIYAKTALYNADEAAFLGRWLKSVRADQGENGAVPVVVPYDGGYPMSEYFFGPRYGETGTIGAAGWGDCVIFVPWAIYCITGNEQILKDNYAAMEKWCEYVLKRSEIKTTWKDIPKEYDRYLWTAGYQQGDWLTPSLCKNQLSIEETLAVQEYTAKYAAPIYAYKAFETMAKISSAIGKEEENRYARIADKMKFSIEKFLFDKDGTMPSDLMGAYVLALSHDLVADVLRDKVSQKLITKLNETGGVLDTGFLSTPYLLKAFDRIGRTDIAFSLLTQTKSPSWLYEIARGATAVWESWGNYEENGDPKKISFNHYVFGCIDEWIFENICGIKATEPGFKSFLIQPIVGGDITFAKRNYKSINGTIYVEWSTENDIFALKVRIPCNTRATIILPSGEKYEATSGEHEYAERYGQ